MGQMSRLGGREGSQMAAVLTEREAGSVVFPWPTRSRRPSFYQRVVLKSVLPGIRSCKNCIPMSTCLFLFLPS